jgi:hypothetical protein
MMSALRLIFAKYTLLLNAAEDRPTPSSPPFAGAPTLLRPCRICNAVAPACLLERLLQFRKTAEAGSVGWASSRIFENSQFFDAPKRAAQRPMC